MLIFFFFFFQAEDGIRDGTVTGVQTCALPISELYASQRPSGENTACSSAAAVVATGTSRVVSARSSSQTSVERGPYSCNASQRLSGDHDVTCRCRLPVYTSRAGSALPSVFT